MQHYRIILTCTLLVLLFAALRADTPPRRILSLAPNITEMVYKLGAGSLLVGRTDFCTYPAGADTLPSIGAYLNPDYERMVTLRPDIVLLLPNDDMVRKLSQLGLATAELPNETIPDILNGIDRLSGLLDRRERGAALIAGIRDTLQWISDQASADDTLSALIVIGREAGSLKSLYTAGADTYLSDIVGRCGVRNVFADVNARYFEVSKEDLVVRDPDFILEFRVIAPEEQAAQVPALAADWQALPTLGAVRNDQVIVFSKRAFLIPGPRVAFTARAIYDAIRGHRP